jgi:hypothetical protein
MPNAFLKALRETPCPYATRAHVECAEQPAFPLDDGGQWQDYYSSLTSLVRQLADSADILAVELPTPADASPHHLLAQVTHTLLAGLIHHAGGDTRQLYRGIESSEWEYTLMNRDFFPLVLSPAYPMRHPRHVRWRQPVILLQLESSFSRHGISSVAEGRERLSATVERAFLRMGKRYHGHITRNLPKAYRVIKPLRVSDPPIRWWDTPAALTTAQPEDRQRSA